MAGEQGRLELGIADHGRHLTAEEFAGSYYDEPWKYERVEGKLVVMSPDSEAHDNISEPIRDRLALYKFDHPEIVEKVVSNAWMVIDGENDRIGEIGVFLLRPDGSRPPARPRRIPELVFEVMTTATLHRRFYEEKGEDYFRAGVREFILIDGFSRKFSIFTREAREPAERVLSGSDVYETPLLPGFRVPLDDVF